MFREERNRKTITPLALDYRMNAFSDANYLQKTLTVFLMSVLVGLHRSPPQLIRAVGGKCPSICPLFSISFEAGWLPEKLFQVHEKRDTVMDEFL